MCAQSGYWPTHREENDNGFSTGGREAEEEARGFRLYKRAGRCDILDRARKGGTAQIHDATDADCIAAASLCRHRVYI